MVAGRNDGGADGGATVALLLPLLFCSFTLLSPFSSFFFCFARAPLLSNKLPPSVFCSSLLLQNFAPWFPFFPFSPPPLFPLCHCLVFIGSQGQVHHTLYKHRAWWPGHGSSAFRHGGGHGSPISPLMRVWVV